MYVDQFCLLLVFFLLVKCEDEIVWLWSLNNFWRDLCYSLFVYLAVK